MKGKLINFLQGYIFCGPENEDCVKSQTLKDNRCLVPCSGLYADISDDTLIKHLKQTVVEGISSSVV